MAKTIKVPDTPPEPDYNELPSWEQLADEATADNERNPYQGPPVWKVIRAMRDER